MVCVLFSVRTAEMTQAQMRCNPFHHKVDHKSNLGLFALGGVLCRERVCKHKRRYVCVEGEGVGGP